MKRTKLGQTDIEISAQGLGCMGMAGWYSVRDDSEARATIARALDLGITFFDTADVYGHGENERFVGIELRPHRDHVIIATKCGNVWDDSGRSVGVDCSPAYVRKACDASLKRLGIDVIDLFYLHRIDTEVPIEDSIGAMAGLVEAGKIRSVGLSEASPATLRRAAQVHPIAALQTEYSLFHREPETEIIPTCRELGTTFVAYSPLSRGLLSGAIRSQSVLPESDVRRMFPRFSDDNLAGNLASLEVVESLAAGRGMTAAQIALAWVHAKGQNNGDDIVPIPGTQRRSYLEQNASAADLALTRQEIDALEGAVDSATITGERYPEHMMCRLNR